MGLRDLTDVEGRLDEKYVLFYDNFRALRKLTSRRRLQVCAAYLVYRYPKVYELAKGSRTKVVLRYPRSPVVRPTRDDSKEYVISITCRVKSDYNSTNEPMDIDVLVTADSSYEAAGKVEDALTALINKKDGT